MKYFTFTSREVYAVKSNNSTKQYNSYSSTYKEFKQRKHKSIIARRQCGYVLVLTLVIMSLLLIMVSHIGQRVAASQSLTWAEKEAIAAEEAIASARAEILFLLASVPRSKNGLGQGEINVALDGRYYRLNENIIVSFQDTRGLINLGDLALNPLRRTEFEKLLTTYNLDLATVSSLTDIFLDYSDKDDFKRLNGAEAADYPATQAKIRNDEIALPQEMARIYRWLDYKELWQLDPISDHITTVSDNLFNPNAATWRTLVAKTGLSTNTAQDFVRARENGSNVDITDLLYNTDLDVFFKALKANPFPAASTRVTIRHLRASWGLQMMIVITPNSENLPWQIAYVQRVALPPLVRKSWVKLAKAEELRDLSVPVKVDSPFFLGAN